MSDFQITSGHVGLFVLLPGDELQVMSGGESFGSIAGVNSREYVAAGGESHADHIESGGTLYLGAGATAKADVIGLGGVLQGGGYIVDGMLDYGLVNGATLQAAAGETDGDVLADFGRVNNIHVGGGTEVSVFGVASRDRVFSGGVEEVHSGAESVLASVYRGGSIVVDSRGAAETLLLGAGASGQAAAHSVVRGATILAGATLVGAESLSEVVQDAGLVSGGIVRSGAKLDVVSGGVAQGLLVASGGLLDIAAGASAQSVSIRAGAELADNGVVTQASSSTLTLAGALAGAGLIVEDGRGTLNDTGDGAAFRGRLTIDKGAVILAGAGGLGKGTIAFEATDVAATLEVTGRAVPASGSTFSSTLTDFDNAFERVDLRTQAFTAGATATVSGSVLTLKDGAYTTRFNLGGTHAATYAVTADADGGTVIRARTAPSTALVQAAASFGATAPSAGSGASRATVDPFSMALAASAPTRAAHA